MHSNICWINELISIKRCCAPLGTKLYSGNLFWLAHFFDVDHSIFLLGFKWNLNLYLKKYFFNLNFWFHGGLVVGWDDLHLRMGCEYKNIPINKKLYFYLIHKILIQRICNSPVPEFYRAIIGTQSLRLWWEFGKCLNFYVIVNWPHLRQERCRDKNHMSFAINLY